MSAGPVAALGAQVCEDDTKVVPGGHVEQAGEPWNAYDRLGHDCRLRILCAAADVGEMHRRDTQTIIVIRNPISARRGSRLEPVRNIRLSIEGLRLELGWKREWREAARAP